MLNCSRLFAAHSFLLTVLVLELVPAPAPALAQNFTVTLGSRETFLPTGHEGWRYFPDEPMSILSTSPLLRVYIVAGNRTHLATGSSFSTLVNAGVVLGPSGSGFDRDYAGVGAVYRTGGSNLLAFYHAEDHSGGLPRCPGNVAGFYASVMLARSTDDGASLTRVGPILQGSPKDPYIARCSQGTADPSVIPDKTNTYLYAYFVDQCACSRGVQIGMARSLISEGGAPGTWWKYKSGAFTTPGLGSYDITPVVRAPSSPNAEAMGVHVVYSPSLDTYVMVYTVIAGREFVNNLPPSESGFYMATSADGIRWGNGIKLINIYPVMDFGKEAGARPTLYLDQSGSNSVSGTLFYAYSERWPNPHHLVGHSIRISRGGAPASSAPATGPSPAPSSGSDRQ